MLSFIIAVVVVFIILKALATALEQTINQRRAARLRALEEVRQQAIAEQLRQERERRNRLVEEQREMQRRYVTQQTALIIAEREKRQALIQAQREEAQARKEAIRMEKEIERATKRENERRMAAEDLEHYTAVREGYLQLLDELQEELDASYTSEKRRNTIRRQILQLEERVYQIDKKRSRAYYLVNEKGA